MLHLGDIPDGLLVCHSCDNPSCVNPKHLFLGTQKKNMQDCKEKGRIRYIAHSGESNGRAKLTQTQVLEIRGSNQSRKELMSRFGISYSMVGRIKQGKSWKGIDDDNED